MPGYDVNQGHFKCVASPLNSHPDLWDHFFMFGGLLLFLIAPFAHVSRFFFPSTALLFHPLSLSFSPLTSFPRVDFPWRRRYRQSNRVGEREGVSV